MKVTSRVTFLLGLAVIVTALLLFIIRDFLLALLIAGVLAAISYPIHERLSVALKGRSGLSALLTVLFTLVVAIVPLLFFLGVVFEQALDLGTQFEPWVQENLASPGDSFEQALQESPSLQRLLPYQDKIVAKVSALAEKTASLVADIVVSGTKGTAEFFLMLFITLYAMNYFLNSGKENVNQVLNFTPLSEEDRKELVSVFLSVAKATLKGSLVIGVIQGFLAGLSFALAGVSGAAFWGSVMAVLSIIPGIGAPLIWVPAVIYLAMTGETGTAVAVGAWCGLVVGSIDNFLRPLLVGKDTQMSDVLVLVTTLGGIVVFGVAGIVIGPIIGALYHSIWKLWGSAVMDANPKAAQPDN